MARPLRSRAGSVGGGLILGETASSGLHSVPERSASGPAAADRPARVLFIFLDGIGLGADDAKRNPLAAADLTYIRSLTGRRLTLAGALEPPSGRVVIEPGLAGAGAVLRPIDATLGVAGRPQSGTGQTALLTGVNAAALMGRHFGPWVPTTLRDLLAGENLFARSAALGASVAFANSYPLGHMAPGGRGARRPGAFPLAASAAGVLVRDEQALRDGRSLVSSITTDSWRRYVDASAPAVTPADAGLTLARIAHEHDLTVFAHFDTDYVGHRGSMEEAIEVAQRVDRFLGAVAGSVGEDTLLVATSDHGNLEDITMGHTVNPVPLLVAGKGSAYLSQRVDRISDLTPAILELLRP